MHVEYSYPD